MILHLPFRAREIEVSSGLESVPRDIPTLSDLADHNPCLKT